MSRSSTLSNPRRTRKARGSEWSCLPLGGADLIYTLCCTVASNIAPWKASSLQSLHSTSLLLEETCLEVSLWPIASLTPNLHQSLLAPALVGNVVVWKPSPAATYSNYLIYQILAEAGVPPGVIQFVPGPPAEVVAQAIGHREFAALHFTGSTFIFKKLWKDIASNLDKYKQYPRIVGETGGKNFHLIHKSADIRNAVVQSVRGGFEYQGGAFCRREMDIMLTNVYPGQKCSALSRIYVSKSIWEGGFKDQYLAEIAKIKVGAPQDWSNFMGPVMFVFLLSFSVFKN